MPTFPPFVTIKLVALDEPTTKLGAPPARPFGFTERSPHGVEEAMPTLPSLLKNTFSEVAPASVKVFNAKFPEPSPCKIQFKLAPELSTHKTAGVSEPSVINPPVHPLG